MSTATRIIVSGIEKASGHLPDAGAVFTLIPKGELEDFATGSEFLREVEKKNIPHINAPVFDTWGLDTLQKQFDLVAKSFPAGHKMYNAMPAGKKMLFVCNEGVDRAPLAAIALLVTHPHAPMKIHDAFMAVYKARPSMRLHEFPRPFARLLGAQYPGFAQKISDFVAARTAGQNRDDETQARIYKRLGPRFGMPGL
jgi:hypothetical protein